MRRLVLRLLPIAIAVAPQGAAAQDDSNEPEQENAGLEGLVDGPESPELRSLRLFEQELFGGQPLAAVPEPGRVRVSDGASAVTTDVRDRRAEAPAARSRDLAWMRGLTLPDIPVRWDDRVVRFLEFFRDDPRGQRFIRGWLRRVDRYGPTIRETLARQRLPRDLIFVAMVESGFDPSARSSAGAAGMWQFVRGTGSDFGLDVDHWVDLRLDPERSTEAAGRYLGQLHGRFGTWELAFAAYNMGYGALLRAIRKYNTNDYWELSHLEAGLPFETSVYVAKILACAIVAHNRERFGLGDLDIEEPLRWESVDVPGGVQLGQLARAAGTDLETMQALNPSLRRARTPAGRDTWSVRVPHGAAERFAERWARIRPTALVHRPRMIRFGETLGDLARAHGTSESALRELNGLADEEPVGAGTVLLVPIGRARAETAPAEAPVVAVPDGPREIPGRRRVFYRVVSGDRVDEISRFFRVRPDELRQWNQMDPDARLQSGMFLQLFVRADVDLSRALVLTPDDATVLVIGSDEFFAYHESQNGRLRFRYRVVSGDTLTHIGRRFGINVSSLARINQIAQSTTLHPGDELVIYAEPSQVPPEYRANALGGDALAPGGEATTERTGPALGAPSAEGADDAAGEEPSSDASEDVDGPPVLPDDPSELHDEG
jgi:membrane-bound lytic murein transglycosylase D